MRSTHTIQTCDRCGREETYKGEPDALSFPGWRRLGLPGAKTDPTTEKDICPSCVSSLGDWWRKPE